MKGLREKNMQKTALFSSRTITFDIYTLQITVQTKNFLPYSFFRLSQPSLRAIVGMVGLWVENQSSPVQQCRIILDEAKEAGSKS